VVKTKNLHFCTLELIKQLKDPIVEQIETYRTGFVPHFYPGEIINLNERMNGSDKYICKGKILYVMPLEYRELFELDSHEKGIEELKKSYKKKFNPHHWIFCIGIKKLEG